MKKLINGAVLIFLTIFFTSFFHIAKAQKTVSYKIANNGSKTISFSQRNSKDNNVGATVYKLDGGKKQSNEGILGNKIVVECNGKKQIFYLGETKNNDFIINCN
jgi:hypothetical protein